MYSITDKVSIIVPIYNAESYLHKCMESILAQSYLNLQIILIDDGSTDDSGNICDAYSKQDSRIEVFHTKNNGSVAARRLGLEVSIGEYIGFVDADDYIEPNMFSELLNNIKKHDADFVHFGFLNETSNSSTPVYNYYEDVFEMENKYDQIIFLCKHVLERVDISPSIWSKLFKSDFIRRCYKNIPDSQQYGEDMICLCCCILEANRISLSKKALYHYMVREKSLSHLDTESYVINEVRLWNCILNVLDQYECGDIANKSVFNFLKRRIVCSMERISENKIRIPRYFFSNLKQMYGKKVILYGAGNVGQDYYTQICCSNKCKIVAWVDQQWYKCNSQYFEVVGTEKIRGMDFDMIIIAIADEQIGREIKNKLIYEGYPEDKICWRKPGSYY